MAKPRGRPFPPGNNANPKGRPKGIQEAFPRGRVRAAFDRVTTANPTLLDQVFLDGLQGKRNARNAVPFVELGAKLGKEIGADAATTTKPTIIIIKTNANLLALEGPVARARRLEAEKKDQGSR